MGINKDFNVDPYYDDFNETKQFNRILFSPSKAVQARELTQLQTILQKQVERFGANIYKEGTVISGVNLTARDDLFFVKLRDQVGFTNPSLYDEVFDDDGESTRFILRGTSGLKAEIVKGLNGFETSAPNLKTFYISYLNTSPDATEVNDIKQFGANETLSLLDSNENAVTINGNPLTFTAFTENHVGRAFAVSCEPGVIYQKGHFIFVDRQFVVVTRYSNVPGQDDLIDNPQLVTPISVGFTVDENIVNSDQDLSLADNALGFNNFNAPGADRLQLVPRLISFPTGNEPTEFFALIRYRDGETIRLRDYTQYSLLGEELARRTYEESGNYVLDGLDASLDGPVIVTDDAGLETDRYAEVSISSGKAYVFGKEVRNISTAKHKIDRITATKTKTNEVTTVNYGQHYKYNGAGGQSIIGFILAGVGPSNILESYSLINSDTKIGTCCVRNIEPGKIYVFNVRKYAGQEAVPATSIGEPNWQSGNSSLNITEVAGEPTLHETDNACMIFDTGETSIASISDTNLVVRDVVSDVLVNASHSAFINSSHINASTGLPSVDGVPIRSTDVFAIFNNQIRIPTSVIQRADQSSTGVSDGIELQFSPTENLNNQTLTKVYYNRVIENTSHDSLTDTTKFISTQLSAANGKASLGYANVIEVKRILMDTNLNADSVEVPLIDITSKFRLVNNQKDSFYDLSYIQLKAGEDLPDHLNLVAEIRHLDRNITGEFITPNSYAPSFRHLVKKHTAKDLTTYDLLNSYDFRPYAVDYGSTGGGTSADDPVVIIVPSDGLIQITATKQFANSSVVNSTHSTHLSRIDSVTIDEYGNTEIVKGAEEEIPSKPLIDRRYEIARVLIPGNTTQITGDNAISLSGMTNKVYRMNDIAVIDKKLDDLKDMVALTMSEMSAKNLIVTGSDGEDRFKNGILTDNFSGAIGSDLLDPQFNCAIDKSKTVITPAVTQFPVDLKISSPVNVSDAISANRFGTITTLEQQESVIEFIEQPYATNFRNCVSNYYNYKGNAAIKPQFDSGYDVIQNPKVELELDFASSMLDLVDNLQEFIPLTREGESTTELKSSYIDRVNRWRDGAPTRVRNFVESTPVESLTSSTRTTNEKVGNFVTDVNMKPFMRKKKIKVFVSGLRPNTRHYFFFDEKDVNSHVSPGKRSRGSSRAKSFKGADRVIGGGPSRKGLPVRSNANGELYAVFYLPPRKFFVGEHNLEVVDVDQYSSIESGKTSYAKIAYRGYNFSVAKSELNVSTRTVDFDTEVSVTERAFQKRTRDPIAQTFRVKSSASKGSNYVYLSDIDVYFKRASLNTGVTLQIRTTANGYPSKTVLPFGEKFLSSTEVSVSDDGITPTKFEFNDPVKLKTDEEYCFVVIPSGNSPEYLIHTCKVGETSKSQGTEVKVAAVTNDWGDGALFTSTNDSAWRSYQDEDIKFKINRYDFELTGSLDLVPNDMEILTVRDHGTEDTDNSAVIPFEVDERVYCFTDDYSFSTFSIGGADMTSPDELTISTSSLEIAGLGTYQFSPGDYIVIENTNVSSDKVVTKILTAETEGQNRVLTIEDPYDIYAVEEGSNVTVRRCVSGVVSHFNPRRRDKLHIKESSARTSPGPHLDSAVPLQITNAQSLIDGDLYTITEVGTQGLEAEINAGWTAIGLIGAPAVGVQFRYSAPDTPLADLNGKVRPNTQVIYGLESGASAKISTVDEEKISFFQANVPIDNTANTSSKLILNKLASPGSAVVELDKEISNNTNVYTTNNIRTIKSKSKKISHGDTVEGFRIKATLNSEISTVTPVLDYELAEMNAYQYVISTQPSITSNFISKEVILNPELPASGIRVELSAYRPAGTFVDVYARFIYPDNSEAQKLSSVDTVDAVTGGTEATNWKKLENSNEDVYSNLNNIDDYRNYRYDLDEIAHSSEFSTFQIRIVLRHATATELNTPQLRNITPDINLFPSVYQYKAIAVT